MGCGGIIMSLVSLSGGGTEKTDELGDRCGKGRENL